MTDHRSSEPQKTDLRRLHDDIKALSREYKIPVIIGPKPMTPAETISILGDQMNEPEQQNRVLKIIKGRS